MIISSVKLKNWRNFADAEAHLGNVTYIVGANASGKSNFLDVFRFMRDVVKPDGGGLQKALADRGGLSKVRCLHARRDPEVSIELDFSEDSDSATPLWRYTLAFKSEGKGLQRPVVSKEAVSEFKEDGEEKVILERPDAQDVKDRERLTQTAIEQIQGNAGFRELATHLAATTYLHLVPQLIKFGDRIGGHRLDSDPFGQSFLEVIAKTPEKTRVSRLNRIQAALQGVVPHFAELRFQADDAGRPHLEARYEHYRPKAGWQQEEQFSDGTLRLIALFWLLLSGSSLLLLEEPELSLNEAIVRQIPKLIDEVERKKKKSRRQIVISTHSEALLENKSIDARYVLRLEPDKEATRIFPPSDEDNKLIEAGWSVAEVMLKKSQHPKTKHSNDKQWVLEL